MEENKDTINKNISEKWLGSIYESLVNLDNFERLARDGCRNVLEYVQIDSKNLPDIQLKNLSLFIGEIGIILPKAKHLLDSEHSKEYKQMGQDAQKCDYHLSKRVMIINGKKIFIYKKLSGLKNKSNVTLAEGFYILLNRVIKIKAELLDNLDDVLFAKSQVIEQREV